MWLNSAPGALLLVTPLTRSLFEHSCLANNYYGQVLDGNQVKTVFIPSEACFDAVASEAFTDTAALMQASHPIQQLVWVEQAAVDPGLLETAGYFEFDNFMDRLKTVALAKRQQEPIIPPSSPMDTGYEVLYLSQTAALLSVSSATAMTIDTLLPRFWKSTLLPTSPVDFIEVPEEALKHVKSVLATLTFNPEVASIVESISVPQLINDIRFLTGEDEVSGIVSRHSFSEGSRVAAKWLKARFEDTGASCELQPFLSGFTPNVVCSYPSAVESNSTIIYSAHYDSRGSFGSVRAPGGDDDGSGTIAILALARTIARRGIKFHSNVQLVAFGGEEQGLLGSRAYARKLREANTNVTLMIQADMLGYHAQDEPPQIGLPASIGTPEVAQLVANISTLYSPELRVGYTAACCSDHQSFHEQGFPATQVFERAGPIVDPMYHNSGDLSDREGYDFGQIKSIAKVQLASLLHTAGYEVSE
ncbi:Peptide hydrolase [Mycena indigotica]|uniref:Peptide hydrolase n=1 Tax=Mycena indigotica TaxID=2126181 RepID=A0A8H6SND4_9AGAR|nr:Peptide hydrolase [Mycena indigotica]KAF7301987.1 Peptide hydrolase [Mycena indigotica]